MRTAEEIRRDNLAALVAEFDGQTALSEILQVDVSQIHQWLKMSPNSKTGKPRVMSADSARMVEHKCGKERGWLDHDHAEVLAGLPPEEMKMLAQWRTWSDAEKRMFQAVDAARREPGSRKKRA